MSEIFKRITELPPGKRRLLEKLLQKEDLQGLNPETILQGRQGISANDTVEKDNVRNCSDESKILIDSDCFSSESRYSSNEIKENKQKFYDLVSNTPDSFSKKL